MRLLMYQHNRQKSAKHAMTRRNIVLAAPFVLLGANIASGQERTQSAISAEVLLTIDGDIAKSNHGDDAIFDLALLDGLPQGEFTTSTIWTREVQVFSGPTLHGILNYVDAGAGDIRARAINDYAISLPRTEVAQDTPIIATRIDGMPFSVREKGPLWIVFPYDRHPRFRSELIYAMSVWQLASLTINPE